MATTDRDWANLGDPIEAACEAARHSGFVHGVAAAIFGYTLVLAFAAALILYGMEAHGAEAIRYRLTDTPIKASTLDVRLTVCQQYTELLARKWRCYGIQ